MIDSSAKNSFSLIGGSGFLGTAIARQLDQSGLKFSILDIKPSATFPEKVTQVDICRLDDLIHGLQGDTIIHLAAVHRDDVRPVSLYDRVNVIGTENVCKAAEAAGINRIVFASSVAVYGFAQAGTDESGQIKYFNDYGRTKWEAEQVLRDWQARDPEARSLTIIRPTVIFGPGNRGNVFNLLQQIASGRFVMIGDGKNTKSVAFIENVASFFVHTVTQSSGVQVFNYVDGPDLTMNELVGMVREELHGSSHIGVRVPLSVGLVLGRCADLVSRLTGKRLPISYIRVKKFVSTTSFVSREVARVGFKPVCSVREGLRTTIDLEFRNPSPERPVFVTE